MEPTKLLRDKTFTELTVRDAMLVGVVIVGIKFTLDVAAGIVRKPALRAARRLNRKTEELKEQAKSQKKN